MIELFELNNNYYVVKGSKTQYTIPLSKLQLRHPYGMAIVSAWKDIFLLFYITETNNVSIKKIAGFTANVATVSLQNDNIIIDFGSNTIWDGITVLPL